MEDSGNDQGDNDTLVPMVFAGFDSTLLRLMIWKLSYSSVRRLPDAGY